MKWSDHRKHSPNVKNALKRKEKLQTNLYGLVGIFKHSPILNCAVQASCNSMSVLRLKTLIKYENAMQAWLQWKWNEIWRAPCCTFNFLTQQQQPTFTSSLAYCSSCFPHSSTCRASLCRSPDFHSSGQFPVTTYEHLWKIDARLLFRGLLGNFW